MSDDIAATVAAVRNDIDQIAHGVPPSGPGLLARQRRAETRADSFKQALPTQAALSAWGAAEIGKIKSDLITGLLSDRRSAETGAAEVIRAAIHRLWAIQGEGRS